MPRGFVAAILMAGVAGLSRSQPAPPPGIRLADISWVQAESALDPSAVVVIPLGAGAKEHGPHLKLDNDERMARYFTDRLIASSRVIAAPLLTYHYYPAFLEYPGSTSLSLGTARDMTVQVVRSLARYGPRRFYVLNTGISTVRPLEAAAQTLADDGVLMRFTDLGKAIEPVERGVRQQAGGSHADEIETSMMLYIDPASVDMSRAVKDYDPNGTGALTRQRGGRGTYSPTGIYGDPTLATASKGRILTEALAASIASDVEALRRAPLPRPATTPPPPSRGATPAQPGGRAGSPTGCTPADERAIRAIGIAFTSAWANLDAKTLAGLWAFDGDVRHPDGTIERGQLVIQQNRAYLFSQRAYRSSRHPLSLTDVRCIGGETAVADGKWELRDLTGDRGGKLNYDGWCTLVVHRTAVTGSWLIEAWRYTVNPPANTPAPTILKQPGFIR